MAETLEYRRILKPLTAILLREKIRYRWSAYTKVQVIYKGIQLIADDLDSGALMLKNLGIEIPADYPPPDDNPEKTERKTV